MLKEINEIDTKDQLGSCIKVKINKTSARLMKGNQKQTQTSIRIMKKLYVNRLENFGKVSVFGYICSSKNIKT